MTLPEASIVYLALIRAMRATYSRSDPNSEHTLSIPAPGKGKAIVLESVSAFYSDQQAQDVPVSYTDRDGVAKSITMKTGASNAPIRQTFPIADVGGVVTKENTSVSVVAPAGGAGETSDIRLNWAVVPEWVLDEILPS